MLKYKYQRVVMFYEKEKEINLSRFSIQLFFMLALLDVQTSHQTPYVTLKTLSTHCSEASSFMFVIFNAKFKKKNIFLSNY